MYTVLSEAYLQKPQNPQSFLNPPKIEKLKNVLRYANISDTLFDQESLVHQEAGFCDGTDTHTISRYCNLETELVQRDNSVKAPYFIPPF